ncbi:MAG: deoxynucleoside kinase [Deltaproteobacteria bacterium]|nr:deoxynucleoside kinase [Deltaproteobacteria bacterium]
MTTPKRFIALAGNIGTGKTTAAKILSRELGYELFDEPVIDNRFLRHYYADMKRWSFTLQLEFLIRRVEHHELIATVPKSCVQDRTLYEDPEIFAKYLHGLGYMTGDELDLYFEYFDRLSRSLHKPDLVIMLQGVTPTGLLDRIKTRGRKEEQGIPEDFLQGLSGYYLSFPMVCKEKYGLPVVKFDVSETDIRKGPGRQAFLDAVQKGLDGLGGLRKVK